jgi:glycosyltransferase involved in cell wall biosynthesis
MKTIFIDATNIGIGGGVTHLLELLNHFDSRQYHMNLVVCASEAVLKKLPEVSNVKKITHSLLNKSIIHRGIYQLYFFDKEISACKADLLFSITGDYIGNFHKVVGMSRNMLLYDELALDQISSWKEKIRFRLNFIRQKRCFNKAKAIIFISEYSKDLITKRLSLSGKRVEVIYHGLANRFKRDEKPHVNDLGIDVKNPINFIYISTVHVYKHQWNVVEAVGRVRNELGLELTLTLVGDVIYEPSGRRMFRCIEELDAEGKFVQYLGNVQYEKIHELYKTSSAIIFASSCENMPNTLIEGMASGLPILCSNFPPMPEFLKEGGFYCNPYHVDSIVEGIKELLANPEKQAKTVMLNQHEMDKYDWAITSQKTFEFLNEICEYGQ